MNSRSYHNCTFVAEKVGSRLEISQKASDYSSCFAKNIPVKGSA